jgi:hypothetical protein
MAVGEYGTIPRHKPNAIGSESLGTNANVNQRQAWLFSAGVSPAARCSLSKHGVRQSKCHLRVMPSAIDRLGARPARRESAVAAPDQISPQVPLKPLSFAVYARLDCRRSGLLHKRAGLAIFA